MMRHRRLLNVTSDVSPIHWQHGAIARLAPGASITPLLKGGYSTLTIGYIGLYEAALSVVGVSHTEPDGTAFALRVLDHLEAVRARWTEEEGVRFAVYGTPAESLTHRFCRIDRARFGSVPDITDKGYYTNSYHVDVREAIDVFSKFRFEAAFQAKSTGGMISYAEIPNMEHNVPAILDLLQFIYRTIMYAEFNTRADICHSCGFTGEITVRDGTVWTCPACGETDRAHLTVIRRTCGYLGENFWNEGRTREIAQRVLHL